MAHDPITEAFVNAVKSVAVAFPQVPAERIERALDIIRNPEAAAEPPKPRAIYSHAEAAALLGISTQALSRQARLGHVRRAYITGQSRAAGYVAADIDAIVTGENTITAEQAAKNAATAAKAAATRKGKERD